MIQTNPLNSPLLWKKLKHCDPRTAEFGYDGLRRTGVDQLTHREVVDVHRTLACSDWFDQLKHQQMATRRNDNNSDNNNSKFVIADGAFWWSSSTSNATAAATTTTTEGNEELESVEASFKRCRYCSKEHGLLKRKCDCCDHPSPLDYVGPPPKSSLPTKTLFRATATPRIRTNYDIHFTNDTRSGGDDNNNSGGKRRCSIIGSCKSSPHLIKQSPSSDVACGIYQAYLVPQSEKGGTTNSSSWVGDFESHCRSIDRHELSYNGNGNIAILEKLQATLLNPGSAASMRVILKG